MRFTHKSISITVIAVLMTTMLSCRVSGKTMRRVTREQYYMISPDSILQSLTEGKQDVFSPLDTEPQQFESSQHEWITWHQSDFLQVAEAAHKKVWNEPLDEWKVNFAFFSVRCDQVG